MDLSKKKQCFFEWAEIKNIGLSYLLFTFIFFIWFFTMVSFFFTEILFNRFLFFSLITVDDKILFIWFV